MATRSLYTEDDNFIVGSGIDVERLRRDARQFHNSAFSETRRKAHYARFRNSTLKVSLDAMEKRMDQEKEMRVREIERARADVMKRYEKYYGQRDVRRASLPGTSLRATLATGETNVRLAPMELRSGRRWRRGTGNNRSVSEVRRDSLFSEAESWMRQKGFARSALSSETDSQVGEQTREEAELVDETRQGSRSSSIKVEEEAKMKDVLQEDVRLEGVSLLQVPPSRDGGSRARSRAKSRTSSRASSRAKSRANSVAESGGRRSIANSRAEKEREQEKRDEKENVEDLNEQSVGHEEPTEGGTTLTLPPVPGQLAVKRISSSKSVRVRHRGSARVASARSLQEQQRHQEKVQLNERHARNTDERVWRDFDDLLKWFAGYLRFEHKPMFAAVGAEEQEPTHEQQRTFRSMRNTTLEPSMDQSYLSQLYFQHGIPEDSVIRLC